MSKRILCSSEHLEGWHCTLTAGHPGRHEAHGVKGMMRRPQRGHAIIASWDSESEPARRWRP